MKITNKINKHKSNKRNPLINSIAGLVLSLQIYFIGGCVNYPTFYNLTTQQTLTVSNKEKTNEEKESNISLENILSLEKDNTYFIRAMDTLSRETLEELVLGFDKIIQSDSTNLDLGYNLGFVYNMRGLAMTKLGRIDDAISDFLNSISIKPENAETFDYLKKLGFRIENESHNLYLLNTSNSDLYIWDKRKRGGERERNFQKFNNINTFRIISENRVLFIDDSRIYIVNNGEIESSQFHKLYLQRGTEETREIREIGEILFVEDRRAPLTILNPFTSERRAIYRLKKRYSSEVGISPQYTRINGDLDIEFASLELFRFRLFPSQTITPYLALDLGEDSFERKRFNGRFSGKMEVDESSVVEDVEENEFTLELISFGLGIKDPNTKNRVFPEGKFYRTIDYRLRIADVKIHNEELIRVREGYAMIHSLGLEMGWLIDNHRTNKKGEISEVYRRRIFIKPSLVLGDIIFFSGERSTSYGWGVSGGVMFEW